VHARFAVAADGMKSPLRAVMLPQDPGPRYAGLCKACDSLQYGCRSAASECEFAPASLLQDAEHACLCCRYLGHMNFNALLYNPGGQETVDAHLPGQLKVFTDVPMGLFGVMW